MHPSRLCSMLLGLASAGMLTQACSQPPSAEPAAPITAHSQENRMSLPTASRPPPPQVPAVEHQGVRYEQETQGRHHGLDRDTGYLLATDPASGERLWTVKVYETGNVEHLEADVQWVYFKQMSLIEGRDALLIENENGQRFIVDLQQRSVSPAP